MSLSFSDLVKEKGREAKYPELPIVCVQGLGFVGSAMAIAVAKAIDENGKPLFNVAGVDLENELGKERVSKINSGYFPFEVVDNSLKESLSSSVEQGNLIATTNPDIYSKASIVVVDVPLDIKLEEGKGSVPWGGFRAAIRTLGERVSPGTLILVETTVPPGTCEKVVKPELVSALEKRGIDPSEVLLAHSYERVMPGPEYLDSVVNFWRVFSGETVEAADRCEEFLSKVVNVEEFPLTRLSSMRASETAKVLENSYRAVNIAFIEEWGRFAEGIDVDLFSVINAVRYRPTHNNIRQPGFGVGGYCLTKDPLFAEFAAKELFENDALEFPFCRQAVDTNNKMPLVSLNYLESFLGGDLKGKKILLCGVSYRSGVEDTRYSPSEIFVREANKKGAKVEFHDPLVRHWDELDAEVLSDMPRDTEFDAVVFAVPHEDYLDLSNCKWSVENKPLIFDANNVLSSEQEALFIDGGHVFKKIGKGM